MKTTKQIYLLMEKKGRELAALAEGLDKIIVTEETLRNMFDGKETDSVNASPILEKGVSVQAGDKIKDYLIFEVMDREEDSFKIHCESYQEYCGKEKNTSGRYSSLGLYCGYFRILWRGDIHFCRIV